MTKAKAAEHEAAPSDPETFAVGDRVTHVAPGEPEMEVTEIEPDGSLRCHWWSATHGLKSELFKPVHLKKVAPAPVHTVTK